MCGPFMNGARSTEHGAQSTYSTEWDLVGSLTLAPMISKRNLKKLKRLGGQQHAAPPPPSSAALFVIGWVSAVGCCKSYEAGGGAS